LGTFEEAHKTNSPAVWICFVYFAVLNLQK